MKGSQQGEEVGRSGRVAEQLTCRASSTWSSALLPLKSCQIHRGGEWRTVTVGEEEKPRPTSAFASLGNKGPWNNFEN